MLLFKGAPNMKKIKVWLGKNGSGWCNIYWAKPYWSESKSKWLSNLGAGFMPERYFPDLSMEVLEKPKPYWLTLEKIEEGE
jgi:hypothetical protein